MAGQYTMQAWIGRELRHGAAGHRAPARRRAEHRLLSHARGTDPAALPEMRKETREDRRLLFFFERRRRKTGIRVSDGAALPAARLLTEN